MKEAKISVRFDEECGRVKPMHATNNGPTKGRGFGSAKTRGFEDWREAGIPYARTHDSSFNAGYGGEHTVDVHAIFPNFDADVSDPASYDFAFTDQYLSNINSCGTEVFYRLGTKIEHGVKKYHTLPPKDFQKWAEICEHIILHYTEGWADGFTYKMEYWEIWAEPDLDPDDAEDKRTWGGTAAEFYRFYITAARHLKKRFPHLKIGGPAVAFRIPWLEGFFEALAAEKERVPLDFFSFHCYGSTLEKIFARSTKARELLNAYGYENTESILDEWNYVQGWDNFIYSVKHIISIKGAAFEAFVMCACQNDSDIDMLMYYDARPSVYNGLFDYYTNERLKGYYPFKMFHTLYQLGTACHCEILGEDIRAAAAKGNGESALMIAYFNDNDEDKSERKITLSLEGGAEKYDLYILDETRDCELVKIIRNGGKVTMKKNTVCLLRSHKGT